MRLVTESTGEVVSTDEKPVIASGLDVDLSCHSCGAEFHLSDAGKWVPGGHGKWCEYECPECGTRVAREKGTNRYFDEDTAGKKIADAFEVEYGEDGDALRKPSTVDVDDLEGGAFDVVVFYPDNGGFDRMPVVDGDADDHDDAVATIERRDDDVDTSWYHDDVDAAIVYPNGEKKPVGYPAEWDEDDEDFAPGRANKEVTRFVEVR